MPAPYTITAWNEVPASAVSTAPVQNPAPAGDAAAVWVNVTGAVLNSFADSAGNTWTLAVSRTTSPRISCYTCAALTAPLTAADTFTITSASAPGGISVIARGLPGGVTAADQAPAPASATSNAPSNSTGPLAQAGEWALGAISNGSSGGQPSGVTAGWAAASAQHPGTSQWLTVYDQITASASALTLAGTIATSVIWADAILTLTLPAAGTAAAAGQAAAAGTSPPPAPAAASPEQPAAPAGAGTAPQPSASASNARTVTPAQPAGTGAAPQPSVSTGQVRAGLAAGAGTASTPAPWAYSEVAGFMADSLVLARVIELLGGGVRSAVPQCAGAIFRLGRGYDLGSPQPVVDLLMTLMGDGSRPLSWRADNRTITLPVTIIVPSTGNLTADRLTLAAARELLLQAIADDEFTLTWAPDGQNGALTLIWDCFRAHAAQVAHDVLASRQLISQQVITFDALPYGRSDTIQQLTFDSPVLGQTAPVTPLTIDDYSTVASTTQVTWFAQSPVTALFSSSARWLHPSTDSNSPLQYTRTLPAAVNLTAYGKLTCYLGLGADPGEYRLWQRNTPVTVTMTLTDNLARTLSFSTRIRANASADNNWPVWNQVTLTIPQGRTFNYNNVVSYQLTAWNQVHTWLGRLELSATGYLSGLRATYATSPKRPASIRGGSYVLYDTVGSAPAPLSVHCQLGYVEQQASTRTLTLPGTPGTVNQYAAPPENPNWLSGDTASFDTGTTGAWTGSDGAAANATLAASQTQAHSGAWSMRMTPVTGGTSMTAASAVTANVPVQGVPVSPGDRVAVRAWVRAGTTSRNVTVGAQFFTAAGAALATVSLTAVADSTTAWTQVNGRVTAPASAAFARLVVTVATPAAGEFHYVDDAYLAYAVQATVACNAAGGGGGSSTGRQNAAGGAGGGEIAWEVNLDLTPAANHAYQIGARGAPGTPVSGVSGNGADGGDSYFTGATVQVLAHGGKGGRGAWNPYTSGPAAAGGTGSTNSHHFDGGAGSAGDYTQWEGGGGGGGAGDGGAGAAAGTGGQHNPGAGGSAGALGIAGGAGDQGYGGQSTGVGWGGDATAPGGTRPGGGGAGSASNTQNHSGSTGGNGQITMTIKSYTASSTFPAVLVHKPPYRPGLLAVPVMSVGGGADPPDGREYQVPQIDNQNARYDGTYTLAVCAWTWDGTAARNVTATIRQYSSSGGTSSAITLTSAITPASAVNGLFILGEVSLPVLEIAPDNTDSYYTVSVQSDDTADRFLDLLLLHSQASTVLINLPGGGYTDYYLDAPDTTADLGRVLGSSQGRGSAVSVLGNATIVSGNPLRIDPGDNLLTVYSPAGMPAVEADYFPHWYHERLA